MTKALGRKVAFGIISLGALLGGLSVCVYAGQSGAVLFPAYATTVGAIVTAVVVGNVGEHLAKKGQP